MNLSDCMIMIPKSYYDDRMKHGDVNAVDNVNLGSIAGARVVINEYMPENRAALYDNRGNLIQVFSL